MNSKTVRLVDEAGQPFVPRIERVLFRLLPRMRRQFPAIRDDVAVAEILEEAGRRIVRREQRGGALAHLPGYAWVTVRTVATSRLRRGDARLLSRILPSKEGYIALLRADATSHTAAEIERALLRKELLAMLTLNERHICEMKSAGFSTQQIARRLGRSEKAIDTLFSRAKVKARRLALASRGQTTGPARPA